MNVHIAPITVKQATALVKCWHRHLPKVQGGLFAAAVAIEDEIFAVAIVGNPPRVWQGTGRAVILRVAVSPCAPEEIAGHARNGNEWWGSRNFYTWQELYQWWRETAGRISVTKWYRAQGREPKNLE